MKDDIKVIQITGWRWRRNQKKVDINKVREALLGLAKLIREEKENNNKT